MELSKLMGCVKRPFIPSELFRGGLIDGAWFDPSDMSTLYQDAEGTTPVTAVGQPVGLVLDKSQGLQLGPELKAQYSIVTIGSPTNLATYNPETGDGYAYRLDGINASGIKLPVPSGKTYRIIVSISDGALTIRGNGVAGTILVNTITTGAKTLTVYVPLGSALWFSSSTNASEVNFNIGSVKELYGYHATQPITASRPTLVQINGLYGLSFDGIDDYLNLPYMGLYAGGSASVVMAKSADYQTDSPSFLAETSSVSATPTTPTYQLLGGNIQPYSLGAYIRNDAGVTTANTKAVLAMDAQSTAHIVTIIDSGALIKRFNNSSIADSDAYTRSNPLTVDRTVIGAFYSGASIYNKAVMNLYGLIITKSALTDAQRIKCERYAAIKAGVTL